MCTYKREGSSKQFYSNSKTVLSAAQMKNAVTVGAFIGTMRNYTGAVIVLSLFITCLLLLGAFKSLQVRFSPILAFLNYQ